MNYKIPTNITQKIQKLNTDEKDKNKMKEIYDKLDNVSSKYTSGESGSNIDTEKINLEKMDFVKPTTEEIKEQGENLLKGFKQGELENINTEFDNKEHELNLNKSSMLDKTSETKTSLDDYYKQAITNTEDQALKRGLARSSIVVNQLEAFEKEKINDYKQLDEKFSNEINAINFELNALSGQKEKALNNFDVSYAVKLQEKINNLTEDLNKKESEVLKYNNEISLKESEFNKKVDELRQDIEENKWDENIDLLNIYGKYGANIVQKIKNDEIYNTAKDLLSNLTKEERAIILQDDGFKQRLGDNYNKIVKDFS